MVAVSYPVMKADPALAGPSESSDQVRADEGGGEERARG
jgi:hypothetical protein